MLNGFIGTYTTGKSRGIYNFSLDENSGKIIDSGVFAEVKSPKYICLDGNYLFSISEFEENSGISVFDFAGNLIDEIQFENSASCHISKYGSYIYTSNFHSGNVSKIGFVNEKLSHLSTVEFGKKAGCHQVISDGVQLYAFCLNLDKMFILDENLAIISDIQFPVGSGVRHGAFTQNNSIMYVISELSGEIFTLLRNRNNFEITSKTSLLDKNTEISCAAIRTSLDQKHLYISNRGDNSIYIFDISNTIPRKIQVAKSGGAHPRDFTILADKFLLAVNRDSDNLCILKLENGKIVSLIDSTKIPEAISIVTKGE